MTPERVLLSVLIFVTAMGVLLAYLGYRREAAWRRRDLLKALITRWAQEVSVPTPTDALRDNLPLPVEQDPNFPLARKVTPRKVRHQFQECLNAGMEYSKACQRLYGRVAEQCIKRTGLPLGTWGHEQDWPEEVLSPPFVESIFRQLVGKDGETFTLEDAEYNISRFSSSRRSGLWLHFSARHQSFSGTLAEMTDEAAPESARTARLNQVQVVYKEMLKAGGLEDFAPEVAHIMELREIAEHLAEQVRVGLSRIATS